MDDILHLSTWKNYYGETDGGKNSVCVCVRNHLIGQVILVEM